jgi:hypothetical protein
MINEVSRLQSFKALGLLAIRSSIRGMALEGQRLICSWLRRKTFW